MVKLIGRYVSMLLDTIIQHAKFALIMQLRFGPRSVELRGAARRVETRRGEPRRTEAKQSQVEPSFHAFSG